MKKEKCQHTQRITFLNTRLVICGRCGDRLSSRRIWNSLTKAEKKEQLDKAVNMIQKEVKD